MPELAPVMRAQGVAALAEVTMCAQGIVTATVSGWFPLLSADREGVAGILDVR